MPVLFAATSASTAAGWGLLFAPSGTTRTARRVAAIAGPAVLIALQQLHAELGPRQKVAYETGEAAWFSNAAKFMNVAGTTAAVLSKYYAPLSRVAGALLLGAGLAERFGVFRAGCNSARDPGYTIDAQRNGESKSETYAQSV
jgi:hypothetical protein